MASETILTFEHDGQVYEIDHLGAGEFDQWGEFAVYCGPDMIASFAIPESLLKPEYRPELPPAGELIALAKAAVAEFTDGEVT